jgi:hypothetical protein
MATGKHGSAEVTFTLDDAPGGTGRAIQHHITGSIAVAIASAMEEATAFGDSWTWKLPAGVRSLKDIPIGGFFDDTANTGPHAVLSSPDYSPTGTPRNLVVVYGNSKTATTTVWVQDYEVTGTVGKLSTYKATLTPAYPGTVTWS